MRVVRSSVMDDAIAFRVLWLAAPQCQDDVPLRLDFEEVAPLLVAPPPPRHLLSLSLARLHPATRLSRSVTRRQAGMSSSADDRVLLCILLLPGHGCRQRWLPGDQARHGRSFAALRTPNGADGCRGSMRRRAGLEAAAGLWCSIPRRTSASVRQRFQCVRTGSAVRSHQGTM